MSMWDIVQHVQIRNVVASQSAATANAEIAASRSRNRDEDLEDTIERLTLVAEAMWELLSAQAGLTVDDLVAKVREVDARDGAVDRRRGRRPGAQRLCPGCQAVVPAELVNCQFCGTATPGTPDPFTI